MTIDANFDSGNIIMESETLSDVSLLIRPDSNAESYQWFYFRDVDVPDGLKRTYRIFNASGASYPQAWAQYNVLASYDEQAWFRVPTRYDGSHLIWEHSATQDSASFAFFVPYPASRREALLKEAESAAFVTRRDLGQSTQGRSLDVLVFGDETRASAKTIWIVTRQHAGEPMAEYATEGIIRRLLDTGDAIARQLLEKATVYIVPNMNPDGSTLGNLRANAAGVDLNRVWHDPGDNAPEVAAARAAIAETGVDYFIDMHGDETRPFIWLVGPGVDMSPEQATVQRQFETFLADKHPEVKPPPEAIVSEMPAPGMSVNYIFSTYRCPAWIVELPFRETVTGDILLAEGCMNFGRLCVEALLDRLS